MSEINKVVVLGASGFIGSRLVAALSQKPGLAVKSVDIREADLTDPDQVAAIAEDFDRQTAVVYLAAVKRQLGDNLETFGANLAMAGNLCRELTRRPLGRMVFFSSAAVYGEDVHNLNITEKTPVEPRTYYGIAKFTTERMLWKAHSEGHLDQLLLLRPATIYGPGDHGAPYGPSGFSLAAARGQKVTLWGDGSELREFIFIDDAVNITAELVTSPARGELNLAAGLSYTFRQVLDLLGPMVGGEVPFDSRERTKDKVDNRFDNAKLVAALPGARFTPLEEGLRLTLEAHQAAL